MVEVNPAVLRWARETAALDIEEAARELGFRDSKRRTAAEKLANLECGAEHPSNSHLAKMSNAYHQPPLVFYLQQPPKTGDKGEDFRPIYQRESNRKGNAHLSFLLRDVKVSQSLIRDLLEESRADRLAFVASSSVSMGVDAVALDIIETLEFDVKTFRAAKDVRSAFGYLRRQIERQGIFVLLLSDLGSRHTTIPTEVFRSFAFADELAPYIVINRHAAISGWSFSALYEIAHLWLGRSGVSGAWGDNSTERFCNQVAGKILFRPYDRVNLAKRLDCEHHCVADEVRKAANELNASPKVLAYLLMLDGYISHSCWESLQTYSDEDTMERVSTSPGRPGTPSGAPSYYALRRFHLGERLLDVTRYYVNTGQLSPTRAGVVLSVAPTRVYPLLFPDRV